MSTELNSKIVDIFPSLKEHQEIVTTIVGVLEGEKWVGLDFPHQPHHNFRVYNDARAISALSHCEQREMELLEYGAIVHDLGRNFVEMGLIKESEHQNGSFVLSKLIAVLEWGFDENLANYFAEGIALHVKDVLPRKTDRWIRILRDSDRTSRLGMGGIIDLAWYQGYRNEYIAKATTEQILEDQLLFDSNFPKTHNEIDKYDLKPQEYFNKNILSWLIENNKLQQLANGVSVFVGRIYGIPNTNKNSHRWKIEPVSDEAKFIAKPRIMAMNRFLKANNFKEVEVPNTY